METFEYWRTIYPTTGTYEIPDGFVYSNTQYIQFFKNDDLDDNAYHRLDGPAYFDRDGQRFWSINGEDISICRSEGEIWEGKLAAWAKETGIDLDNLSDADIALIKMVWAFHE